MKQSVWFHLTGLVLEGNIMPQDDIAVKTVTDKLKWERQCLQKKIDTIDTLIESADDLSD
jgi:hypothetical protein